MELAAQASEIAAEAFAKATEFVEVLRPLATAGYFAVEEAIGVLVESRSDEDESRFIRSTAVSGLVAILMEISTEDNE